jgi:hypothetical protein
MSRRPREAASPWRTWKSAFALRVVRAVTSASNPRPSQQLTSPATLFFAQLQKLPFIRYNRNGRKILHALFRLAAPTSKEVDAGFYHNDGCNNTSSTERLRVPETQRGELMAFLKTPMAARQLGIGYTALMNLIRFDHVAPPEKDSSGDYVWTEGDLERVRQALARRKKRGRRRERIAS